MPTATVSSRPHHTSSSHFHTNMQQSERAGAQLCDPTGAQSTATRRRMQPHPLLPSLLPLLLLLLSLAALPSPSHAQLAFEAFDTCRSDQGRLDISALKCSPCVSAGGGSTDWDPAQVVSASSPERCACVAGYRARSGAAAGAVRDEYAIVCDDCVALGMAALRDGSACVPCGAGTTGLDASTRDCTCPPGQIIVEYDQGGSLFSDGKHCSPCNNRTQVFQSTSSPLYDPYTCRACPDPNMVMDATGTCNCQAPYAKTALGMSEVCVLAQSLSEITTLYSPNAAAVMQFNDVRATDSGRSYTLQPSVASIWVYTSFAAATTRCFVGVERHSCQSLANMCALQKYHAASPACLAFRAIGDQIATYEHGFTGDTLSGWKGGLPFLYQSNAVLRTSARLVQQDVTLSNQVSSDRSQVGVLSFRLYAYTFNGTLAGWEPLGTQLQLCGGDPTLMTNFLQFGTNYENSCQLNLTPYISRNETLFYDLYLVDSGGKLYPVPVKVLNLRQGDGDTPNRDASGDENGDDSDAVLTRRFFLVDSVLGGQTDFTSRSRVLTYVRRATLRVEMKGGSSNEMRPPVLVLDYAEREVASILDGGSRARSGVSFRVEYVKDDSGVWRAAYGLFGTAIALSLLLVARRVWVWQRRRGGEVLELTLLLFVRLLVYAFAALGDLFFIMLCALTFYAWLFYKGQQTVAYLLPPRDGAQVDLLRDFVIVCFVAKLVDVLFKLYTQVRVDVFFIDWEKPRWGAAAGGVGEGDASDEGGGGAAGGSVSVWRKLMAANQWNDLQTLRLVNVPLTLFFLIFLLEPAGLGLKFLATAQPDPGNLESTAAPLHPVLSFAVTTFFLLVVCYAQVLFRKQVMHRYYKDEAAQFVDLLCTSNISALLLDDRAHGWYVHGKTVHPHADVSLEEMSAALRSEERTLTRERGLQPGKDTFELYVTPAWRHAYDELYSRLFTKQALHAARAARAAARGHMDHSASVELELARGGGLGRGGMSRGRVLDFDREAGSGGDPSAALISAALLRANASLNQWLQAFIGREPQFPFPYDFGERDAGRRLLGLPPALPPQSPCTLYDDPDFNFTSVLMCGMESDLILLLVLLYALCNILFDSILVATLVCYIVDR